MTRIVNLAGSSDHARISIERNDKLRSSRKRYVMLDKMTLAVPSEGRKALNKDKNRRFKIVVEVGLILLLGTLTLLIAYLFL